MPVVEIGVAGAPGMRRPGNLEHDAVIHSEWDGVSGDVCVFGDFRKLIFFCSDFWLFSAQFSTLFLPKKNQHKKQTHIMQFNPYGVFNSQWTKSFIPIILYRRLE